MFSVFCVLCPLFLKISFFPIVSAGIISPAVLRKHQTTQVMCKFFQRKTGIEESKMYRTPLIFGINGWTIGKILILKALARFWQKIQRHLMRVHIIIVGRRPIGGILESAIQDRGRTCWITAHLGWIWWILVRNLHDVRRQKYRWGYTRCSSFNTFFNYRYYSR
jgi:hypothetical protein